MGAHTGKEGAEAGLPTGGPQGSHWGRALRMAFTSSATAVKANSNWSWEGQWEDGHERADLCSCPRTAFGRGSWGGHSGEGGCPLGEGGLVGEAGCCWLPRGGLAARGGAGRNSHLRADKAGPLVTDMLQGGSDVNLLYPWRLERAQGCSGGGQGRRRGPRKPGALWGGRLGGLGKAWGCDAGLGARGLIGLGCRRCGKGPHLLPCGSVPCQ